MTTRQCRRSSRTTWRSAARTGPSLRGHPAASELLETASHPDLLVVRTALEEVEPDDHGVRVNVPIRELARLDAKGRRQYLYHPLWRLRRDEEKFDDMLEFAERLPDVRAVTRGLLASDHADRERTLALAVRLLDIGLFRVGWDRYARDNGHVGLTTLRRENVTLQGLDVRFDFIAKSGKRRRMRVRDPQSVRVWPTSGAAEAPRMSSSCIRRRGPGTGSTRPT